MDFQSFFYEGNANTMCPNYKHTICMANNEYCQPDNCVALYWMQKMLEDYARNGSVRETLSGS